MKDTNKLNPEVRFSGFTDDWEQREFGEILNVYPFKQYIKEPESNGKYKIIQQGNEPIIGYANGKPFEEYENIVLFGDHTVSLYKPQAPFFVATDGVKILGTTKNLDGNFFNATLEKYKPESEGYKRHFSILKKQRACFTENSDEQRRVGNFFKNLDHLITLHQRKLNGLKNVKKAMLEKMFPKNGESVPEIRFSGFTDDWEQRKLEEIASVYDGVHQTPEYKDEGIMFLSVENIATLTSKKYISEEAYERNFKVRPAKGDILMTRIGDVGTPNVVETSERLAYYVSLALLKPRGINSYFLNNAIQSSSFQHGLRERTLLTAVPMKINKDEIGKVDIFYPVNSDEQRKIGESFKQLDNLITLHQRKLDKLKTLKKAMLEKMFI
ncbi:type I restriction enzyme, S subunit [Streptococcus equinus]|uniref:restriction endonuclease subunit S n=1 Tax=Streptococcus equinus TaxID=1335 RepID=UPI0008CD57D2|nr:restriction endonuclease subunit S [Streptococcus equinus]SEK35984.1 type I restriction enzyme, S subunit [Streptococcus equinus]